MNHSKHPNKGRFYLAASIRGTKGNKATPDTMQENILNGIARAEYLRERLPNHVFYCPHEHEHLFQQAFLNQHIISEAILEQCFSILRLCDALLVCTDPAESDGVQAEIQQAQTCNIPVVHLWQYPEHTWPHLITEVTQA